MKGRSPVLALVALVLALACDEQNLPTGVKAVSRVANIISDGSHGENPDFFFLPPLVQLKKNNPDFELGKFDRAVHAGLVVEICQLESSDADSDHRGSSNSNNTNSSSRNSNSGDQDDRNSPDFPTAATKCVPGELVKRFGPGTVNLVKLPASRGSFPKQLDPDEWYKGRNLPPDGFYYVLWNTRQARLNEDKFYRVTVLRDGSTPLGFVDVDPRSKGHKWRHSRSGQFIQMVDDVKLPIPFRVERGALCTGVTLCTSVVVTGDNPNGDVQVVTVDGGAGAIAGVSFRDGWLPVGPGRPDRVTVTISEVPSAEDPVTHVRTTRCHTDLPFQQFNKCFNFTTTPPLTPPDPEFPDVHFAAEVIVAVCYSLEGIAGDPRRKFSQLYTSGPGERTHALEERNDVGILGPGARNCTTASEGLGFGGSNPLTRFASAGWRKLKGGLGQLFGVKTAYAVDGGLGGIIKRFSNVGPALTAEIEAYPHVNEPPATTELTLAGGTAIARVKIVGNSHHGEGGPTSAGINRVPVTFFTVAEGDDGLTPVGGDVLGTNQLIVTTGAFAGDSGIASVSWTPPAQPGPYTLKATGPTMDMVTFSVTVPESNLPDFVVAFGDPPLTPSQITTSGGTVVLSPWTVTNQGGRIQDGEPDVKVVYYLSTDATITRSDTHLGSIAIEWHALEGAGASYTPQGNTTLAIPARAVGTYYIGILVDSANHYLESNELNNTFSTQLIVVAPAPGPSPGFIELGPTERRMLSMQTGSSIRFGVVAPYNINMVFTNLAVSATGVISAPAGGEEIGGSVGGFINTQLGNGEPGPSLLVNSFSFNNNNPRRTTLVWNAVADAARYEVVTEYGNLSAESGLSCIPAVCGVWTVADAFPLLQPATTALFATIDLPFSNSVRWRVVARDAAGVEISRSEYVYFEYIG
jgi:hypothetical protein